MSGKNSQLISLIHHIFFNNSFADLKSYVQASLFFYIRPHVFPNAHSLYDVCVNLLKCVHLLTFFETLYFTSFVSPYIRFSTRVGEAKKKKEQNIAQTHSNCMNKTPWIKSKEDARLKILCKQELRWKHNPLKSVLIHCFHPDPFSFYLFTIFSSYFPTVNHKHSSRNMMFFPLL